MRQKRRRSGQIGMRMGPPAADCCSTCPVLTKILLSNRESNRENGWRMGKPLVSTFGIWSNKTEGTAGFERAVVEQKGTSGFWMFRLAMHPVGRFRPPVACFRFSPWRGPVFRTTQPRGALCSRDSGAGRAPAIHGNGRRMRN